MMAKERLAEVPPPGVGLKTVACAVPAVAISEEAIAACSWVLLTSVVPRVDPFQLTTEAPVNPLPFTVKVNAAPPAEAVEGDSEVTEGAGLLIVIV